MLVSLYKVKCEPGMDFSIKDLPPVLIKIHLDQLLNELVFQVQYIWVQVTTLAR